MAEAPSRFYYKDGVLKQYTDAEYAAFIASIPTPEPLRLLTNKADIWRRATDEERVMLDGALNDAPAFLRQLYNAVTVIDHSAPEYATLRDAIANTALSTGTIGYTRADVLLAPS